MSSITIYMSPLEPSTIKRENISTPEIEDGGITLFLVPLTDTISRLQYSVGLRPDYENSIFPAIRGSFLLDPVWERSTYQTQQFGSSVTKTKDSITITVQNPTGRIEGIPYWYMTRIDARNPQNVSPHYPFIVSYGKQEPEAITPQEGKTWLYELPNSFVHEETQPKPVPGEYIRVIWGLLVNEKYFEAIRSVKYETPLLTGGWILSKEGEDENVTYTVEIYGVTVSGIKPTDYFDYTGGLSSQRWVYLMKMNATLNDGKQVYGSSNIKDVQDSEYRIVPLNLYGPMNSSCAVPYEDAIKIDSAINFSKVFDMKKYQGEVLSVDNDNDEVEVNIPGASVHTLPVFYYCKDSDTIVGGSAAFTEGDTCIIEKPNPNSWEDAYVIGFPNEIKPCLETWVEFWDGGSITANHPWDTWTDETSATYTIEDETLKMSHGSGSLSSAQTGIYWIYTNGDLDQPPGLKLRLKCSANISGGSSEKNSAVIFSVQDRSQVPQVDVEFYLAYDFDWGSAYPGSVDASGSTDEQVFDLRDYGFVNFTHLAFEMNTISWQGATVSFEWDYIILEEIKE